MYNAIDLSLFEIYISLEMRINKYIFAFIAPNVLHILFKCTMCLLSIENVLEKMKNRGK